MDVGRIDVVRPLIGMLPRRAGMRHRVALMAVAATLSLVPSGTGANAAQPNSRAGACLSVSRGAPGALRRLAFADPGAGWAVGDGTILATVDGGAHWSPQYRGAAHLALVDAVDATHAWALGGGTLLGTADGGRCWRSLSGPASALVFVHFIDIRRGWGITVPSGTRLSDFAGGGPFSGGSVVATVDGGHSWDRMASPPDAESVWFTTPRLGWVGAGGSVYRTEDGGSHWSRVLTPPPPILDLQYLPTVQGVGRKQAWALFTVGPGAAMQSPYLGYHTTDSGRQWTCVLQGPWEEACPAAGRSGDYPGPFGMIGSDTAVFSGHNPARNVPTGEVLVIDGATSNEASGSKPGHEVAGFQELSAIDFVSPTHGWVIGRTQLYEGEITAILMTIDGGAHWAVQYRVTDALKDGGDGAG
jgi:photosystem II stability/assembly factor-like uncharacterized protein